MWRQPCLMIGIGSQECSGPIGSWVTFCAQFRQLPVTCCSQIAGNLISSSESGLDTRDLV